MEKKEFTNITEQNIKEKGVQALADRPNRKAQYGIGGLEPAQLKAWFDNLATFLKDKINTIHDALRSDDAGAYIGVKLNESSIDNLQALIESIEDGRFADLLKVPSYSDEIITLQEFITLIGGMFRDLDYEKLDRIFDFDLVEGAIGKLYAVIRDNDELKDVGINYGDNIIPDGIVQRTNSGDIKVPSPTDDTPTSSAMPKSYVDDNDINEITLTKKENKGYTLSLHKGDGTTKNVEIPFQDLEIVKIDDVVEDGKRYLSITYADGDTVNFELDKLVNVEIVEKLFEDIESKVDKLSYKNAVYATDTSARDTHIFWSGGADANTIVRRTASGTVVTATPQQADDATTKKYVDDWSAELELYTDWSASVNKGYIDALEKRVENIESNSITYVDDETEAYEKIVPARSGKYALVKRVGGKSYYTEENCFNPNKLWYSDISVSVNDDGSATFTVSAEYLQNNYGEIMFYCSSLPNGVYNYRVGIQYSAADKLNGDITYSMYYVWEDLELHLFVPPVVAGESQIEYYVDVEITLFITLLKDTSKTSDEVELSEDTGLVFKPYAEPRFVLVKPNKIESICANLANARGWSADLPYYSDSILKTSNSYGTTINTIEAGGSIIVTQSKWPNPESPKSYSNGFFVFVLNNPLSEGKKYNLSFDLTVTNNPLNVAEGTTMSMLINGSGSAFGQYISKVGEKTRITCSFTYKTNSDYPYRSCIEFRNAGMSLIIGNVMITEESVTDTSYVPFKAEPIDSIRIPDAVLALPDYGKEGSYIEYVDGKWRFVKTKDENGENLIEPSVEDISDKFTADNEIIVQAGGRLRFVSNEENEAVPSEVMYAVRKVG